MALAASNRMSGQPASAMAMNGLKWCEEGGAPSTSASSSMPSGGGGGGR